MADPDIEELQRQWTRQWRHALVASLRAGAEFERQTERIRRLAGSSEGEVERLCEAIERLASPSAREVDHEPVEQ
jgi:hypothetical protein